MGLSWKAIVPESVPDDKYLENVDHVWVDIVDATEFVPKASMVVGRGGST